MSDALVRQLRVGIIEFAYFSLGTLRPNEARRT